MTSDVLLPALFGLAGALVGVLGSFGTSAFQNRSALRLAEGAWLRERRYDVYLAVVREAHERRWLFSDWEERKEPNIGWHRTLPTRQVLGLGQLTELTAKLQLVGESHVRDAWAQYISAVERLDWEMDINRDMYGPDQQFVEPVQDAIKRLLEIKMLDRRVGRDPLRS